MVRIPHGAIAAIEDEGPANGMDHEPASDANADGTRFGYLFPDLQHDPAAWLLLESDKTIKDLISLGMNMNEKDSKVTNDADLLSEIPAGYTYFGQFVDHDVTFTSAPRPPEQPTSCDFKKDQVKLMDFKAEGFQNKRQALLQLEVLYRCPALRDGERMQLSEASESVKPIPRPDKYQDVPRQAPDSNPKFDRAALIGDARNDNNLFVSQLHVAFLRAHNAFVEQGHSFKKAQELLRQHYHWIVLHDFLPLIADPVIVTKVLSSATPLYNPTDENFYLPLEFAVAAYRFGHSMIRKQYYYSSNLGGIGFEDLYPLLHMGFKNKSPTLPNDRLIQWERFVTGGHMSNFQFARRIDTQMVDPLFHLLDEKGKKLKCEVRLAVMDLLRGYMLKLPTGQAVAEKLNLPQDQRLTAGEIKAVAEQANNEQAELLDNSEFSTRTPLWYYVLAEAAHFNKGNRLGPVGSTLVAEVLIGLVRRSPASILGSPGSIPTWKPMDTPTGEFKLRDLLEFAGVFDSNATN